MPCRQSLSIEAAETHRSLCYWTGIGSPPCTTKAGFMMRSVPSTILVTMLVAVCLPATLAARNRAVAQMKGDRRVLIVSSAASTDPLLARQRREARTWREVARERDLVVVEAVGSRVSGASDPANTLRRRYGLPAQGFVIALIGKDGRVAYRGAQPITRGRLIAIIDAMPMRRAGLR